ncbi:GIY-YIG nuclease family protein [Tychonema sp. LEGE 07199]|uniref:GIY-YIG nuclease family protein n=1 Tax=Microcoleaceae TaxID=1892252 RepID=UPI00187EF926|nr:MULTISPECIES: GIY-YIG nuclease family protein [unclassified Tychonema]MBE9124520.1 GIY-YIG nuclease family protein [Tychonema sp. LEGE 07199]MBE9133794.1 GIY-YIG nuclease family protein [Tychonema sp. LEGE 07196]MBE9165175.1 GIY-YIG nuclease family protein [Tychonema sp. LEGE 06208]
MTEDIQPLASLEFIPYIDSEGKLPDFVQGKIGVYAIFDSDKILQFVGYSRDTYLSLKQHLVRQTEYCYWLKVQIIDRPNRTILENIRSSWIAENGSQPEGNGAGAAKWNDPIDTKTVMTAQEVANYEGIVADELAKDKLLKNVARRVENEILSLLKARGVTEEIRFNPKLKTSGLLDLK